MMMQAVNAQIHTDLDMARRFQIFKKIKKNQTLYVSEKMLSTALRMMAVFPAPMSPTTRTLNKASSRFSSRFIMAGLVNFPENRAMSRWLWWWWWEGVQAKENITWPKLVHATLAEGRVGTSTSVNGEGPQEKKKKQQLRWTFPCIFAGGIWESSGLSTLTRSYITGDGSCLATQRQEKAGGVTNLTNFCHHQQFMQD